MTSEKKLKLPKQPETNCSMIDSNITYARKIVKLLDEMENEIQINYCEDPEAKEVAKKVEDYRYDLSYYSTDLEDEFEEIRKRFEALREWGQSWKDLAKDLIVEYDPKRLA